MVPRSRDSSSTDVDASVSRHHRLLLVATLSETDPARQAWSQWREAVVFDDVDQASARLLPILALRTDVIQIDDPLLGRIRGLYRKAWVSNERLFTASQDARNALISAGIPLLHVEAVPLARAFVTHATRPIHDIDVCIPRRSMHLALQVLEDQGWQLRNRGLITRSFHRPRHLIRGGGRLRVIDSVPWLGADESVWETSNLDESGERVLDARDAIVHAAVRSLQPGQQPNIHRVADLVRLTSTVGYRRAAHAIDDERIAARAETHGSTATVIAALRAADRLIGPQAPRTGDRYA
ncbi:unannotated protein [freshwater metagenome]|uniref:Unannotated protein n=1 Tax=freshwater metagenome TaxID=449393 RepID=A0A6J7JWR4_9ZZZZ